MRWGNSIRTMLATTSGAWLLMAAPAHAACQIVENPNDITPIMTDCAEPVQELVKRVRQCVYLSGEVDGEDPARDKEVQDHMAQIGCGRIEDDQEALLKQFKQDDATTKVLRDAVPTESED